MHLAKIRNLAKYAITPPTRLVLPCPAVDGFGCISTAGKREARQQLCVHLLCLAKVS